MWDLRIHESYLCDNNAICWFGKCSQKVYRQQVFSKIPYYSLEAVKIQSIEKAPNLIKFYTKQLRVLPVPANEDKKNHPHHFPFVNCSYAQVQSNIFCR